MMFGRLLSIVVLLGFILPPQSPEIPTTNPKTEYKLFLPLSIHTYPSVDVYTSGYPDGGGVVNHWYCVYGYTTALTQSAVYSVTLAVDILLHDNTYDHTEYISPTLEATLPDQKNTFYHCVYCMIHTCEYKPDGVKLASARLNPPGRRVVYPLTVTSWTKNITETGAYILGTVRNDSGHRLVDIRVVGILKENLRFIEFDGSGPYFEAVLESTTLNPGKKTDFRLDYYYPIVDVTEFSAQGVAEP